MKQKTKNIEYVKGFAIQDMNNTNIEEAKEVASTSDVVVVAVGGNGGFVCSLPICYMLFSHSMKKI